MSGNWSVNSCDICYCGAPFCFRREQKFVISPCECVLCKKCSGFYMGYSRFEKCIICAAKIQGVKVKTSASLWDTTRQAWTYNAVCKIRHNGDSKKIILRRVAEKEKEQFVNTWVENQVATVSCLNSEIFEDKVRFTDEAKSVPSSIAETIGNYEDRHINNLFDKTESDGCYEGRTLTLATLVDSNLAAERGATMKCAEIMFTVTKCHSKEKWFNWIELGKQKIDP